MTTKIHLIVNAVGRFCRLIVGKGSEHDYKQGSALVKDYQPLAGKGYDVDWLIKELQ